MTFRHPWGDEVDQWTRILPPAKDFGASFIRLRCPSVGVFAIEKDNGTLDFPEDGSIREFCVTGWEYLAARDTGRLPKRPEVIESYTFRSHMDFSKYVDHFYSLKKTLDRKSAEYLYAKLFLNSLYGKFAANPDNYRNFWVIPAEEVEEGDGGEIISPAKFKGGLLENYIGDAHHLALLSVPLGTSQERYYNVATAASITGFVRAMLWRALHGSKDPFYCDTDSIIARAISGDISEELGSWKVEFEGKRIAVAGKKLYALNDGSPWTGFDDEGRPPKGWKIASKGSRLTGPQIFEVASGQKVKWRKEAPSMSLKMGTRFLERNIRRTK